MIKKRLYLSGLALLGLVSVWLVVAAPPTAGEKPNLQNAKPLHLEMTNIKSPGNFNIDHFKVYRIDPRDVSAEVWLRGQFDDDFKYARLYLYTRFLNPVDKNNEGILNKYAHLNWYDIETENEPTRQVTIHNQFGLQTLKIDRAVALLAPTEKVEPGSQFPKRLDHYKVYVVIDGEAVYRDVVLKDQFGGEDNIAMRPMYFAVPVEKRHDDYFPINFPEDHIVFYDLRRMPADQYRPTIDQFGDHKMKTLYSELLGVPSWKLAWQ